MTSVDVRHAARPDLPHLASTLARAFDDDPIMAWFFPDEAKRRQRLPRFMAALTRVSSLPHGHVYTTDGWAGAALWNPPGTWQTSLLGQFRLFLPLAGLLGTRLPTLAREGVPAYLESSKERNIPFYARHGFEVTSQMDLPGGPPMWPMWRDPR